MNEKQIEVWSSGDGDVYCWTEQQSSVMLKAVWREGDSVELQKQEAIDLAHALLKAAEKIC